MASFNRRGPGRVFVAYRGPNHSLQVTCFDDVEISQDRENWDIEVTGRARAQAFVASLAVPESARIFECETAEEAIEQANKEEM